MYNPGRGSSSDFKNRNSNQQSYSRAGASKEEDSKRQSRRNRWDETDDGDSGYRRQRDRSRSPSRHTSERSAHRTDGVSGERLNPHKKASNNWSDSSSDEDKTSYGRSGGGGRRDYDERSSKSRWDKDKRSDGATPIEEKQDGQRRKGLYSEAEPSKDLGVQNMYAPDPIRSVINNLEAGIEFINPLPLKTSSGIQMKLLTQLKPIAAITPTSAKPKPCNVASVFNVDDDDEPEEMPAECKMRMKNVGRETPTSAGPNSFGKTKIGFCNVIQIKERKIQEQLQKK